MRPRMEKYHVLFVAIGILDTLSAVAGIICMSHARCINMMQVASDEEAYCQFNAFHVGCCHVRKKPAFWGQWSTWGSCSVTCGSGGTRTSTRTCMGSGTCQGSSWRTEACSQTQPCPIDGYLSDWSSWTPCSQTCGYGQQTRSRVCHQPQYGGLQCNGDLEESKFCHDSYCQVNGWTEDWSSWTSCSMTCGNGYMSRSRVCHPPQYGGSPCTEKLRDFRSCSRTPCPVDGVLSDWSSWTSCSLTCGWGQQTRSRVCQHPQYGGSPCNGDLTDSKYCHDRYCPVDGFLSDWGSWISCSQTCGWGQQTRSRVCHQPQYGGSPCKGALEDSKFCFNKDCPVDGFLSDWSSWTPCSKTCDNGQKTRSRVCHEPKNGGSPCIGDLTDQIACHVKDCEGHLVGK